MKRNPNNATWDGRGINLSSVQMKMRSEMLRSTSSVTHVVRGGAGTQNCCTKPLKLLFTQGCGRCHRADPHDLSVLVTPTLCHNR